MKILGIDYETGGPDANDFEGNFITEIGAVLWDTDFNAPVKIMSKILNHEKEIDPFIEEYTGITTEMCAAHGENDLFSAYSEVGHMIKEADYVVAHNGTGFDKPLTDVFFKRLNLGEYDTPWIDTKTDVPYPRTCLQKNLTYLSAFHRILPGGHRAIFDVMAMLEIMFKYDLKEVIRISKSALLRITAHVGFEDKELAKEAGFRWDPKKKTWFKEMKECFYTDAIKNEWSFIYSSAPVEMSTYTP